MGPFSCGFVRLDFACQRTRVKRTSGWHDERGATDRSGHPSLDVSCHVLKRSSEINKRVINGNRQWPALKQETPNRLAVADICIPFGTLIDLEPLKTLKKPFQPPKDLHIDFVGYVLQLFRCNIPYIATKLMAIINLMLPQTLQMQSDSSKATCDWSAWDKLWLPLGLV